MKISEKTKTKVINFYDRTHNIRKILIVGIIIMIMTLQVTMIKYVMVVRNENDTLLKKVEIMDETIDSFNKNIILMHQLPKLPSSISEEDDYSMDHRYHKRYNKKNGKPEELIAYEKSIVDPADEILYNYILTHNSYSHPLSECKIWNIIATLNKCDNDPKLLLAIAYIESSFNENAVSKSGCLGLMQINPIHGKEYNFVNRELFDGCFSIKIADQLISKWKKYNTNMTIKDICRKYLGCHSDNYVNKILEQIKKIEDEDYSEY